MQSPKSRFGVTVGLAMTFRALCWAQEERPPLESVVHASPAVTQDRQFAASRFWLLDPGSYEAEVWYSNKFQRDGSTEGLLQVELEIGLAPQLQLDLYQNLSILNGRVDVEGNQIELRYAFADRYNGLPFNPVLYLEWHPRKNAQDRAEVRLLLGGDGPGRMLYAVNVFVEANIDGFRAATAVGSDLEAGVTGAANFPVAGDFLRLGAELRTGVDQHGGPQVAPVLMVGPNLVFKAPRAGLKITATLLFGLLPQDPVFYPFLIGGWQF